MGKTNFYKADGVDIDAGDAFSKYASELTRQTYQYSNFVEVFDLARGNFRGPRGFLFKDLPRGYIITGGMDGVGTKVVIIDAAGNFQDAASNILTMTAMDITRYGGLPLVFLNILDVRSLGEVGSEKFKAGEFLQLAKGYGIAAKVAGKILPKQKSFTVAIKSKFGDSKMLYY